MNKKKLIKFSGLDNDIVLRIYAVLLAVTIWFIMSITLFPTITKTVKNVPLVVDLEGTSATNYNLEPINFENQFIDVEIKGKRFEIGSIRADDLIAKVTPVGVNSSGSHPLAVQIISKEGKEFEVISISPEVVNVQFDTVIEKEFIVTPQAPYILTPPEYLLEAPISLPETITIKGPQQQIERIDKVVIRANSTDEVTSSQSINDTEILLYDGDVILDKSLFTFNTENFSITIPVYMTKELPFSLQIQNAPPHFDVSSLKLNYSDEKIKVAGSAFVLENMDTISLGYIDLRDIDLDSSFEYSVVLPNDFRNLSDINTVTVSLNTDNLSSKVISLTKEQIHVINVPSEYDVDILSVGISNITIIGPSSVINRITPEDIIAEVDLRQEDIDQNTYTKTAKIYCPQNSKIWALDKINVGLEFTLKN